jgi:predicted nucleic acid-binding protein
LNPCVVDASVAVKWFLPETHSKAAAELLRSGQTLLAPDLLWPEFGNALAKRCAAGQLRLEEAERILDALGRSPLEFHAARALIPDGMRIAAALGRLLYDSLYLALAVRERVPLVTADRKYFRAILGSRWAEHVVWIEDVKE